MAPITADNTIVNNIVVFQKTDFSLEREVVPHYFLKYQSTFPRQIKNLYPVWLPALPSTSKTHTGFRFCVFCLFNDVGGTGVDFSQNYVRNISLLYKPIKLNI